MSKFMDILLVSLAFGGVFTAIFSKWLTFLTFGHVATTIVVLYFVVIFAYTWKYPDAFKEKIMN